MYGNINGCRCLDEGCRHFGNIGKTPAYSTSQRSPFQERDQLGGIDRFKDLFGLVVAFEKYDVFFADQRFAVLNHFFEMIPDEGKGIIAAVKAKL